MNEDIARVSDAIAQHVTAFLTARLHQEFHVSELHSYCAEHTKGYIAPGSPDRILRSLRQKGKVNYEVVSRSQSLYRAIPLEGQLF